MESAFIKTPIGIIRLEADDHSILSARFHESAEPCVNENRAPNAVLAKAIQQLDAYFEGSLKSFDLPLSPPGTTFQQKVWKSLQQIPYGSTTTYLTLAKKLGDPKAIRAVGRANGQNPLAVIIPCHRVIGSDNSLIGYAGGIERKRQLLQHEGALLL